MTDHHHLPPHKRPPFRGVDSRTPNLAARGFCCAVLGTVVLSLLFVWICYLLSSP